MGRIVAMIGLGMMATATVAAAQDTPESPQPRTQPHRNLNQPPPSPTQEVLATAFQLGATAGRQLGLLDEKLQEVQAEVDYWRKWCGPRAGCASDGK